MPAKIGRPLSSPQKRTESVTLRLNPKELECLQSYAWRYECSVSDVVRDCLSLLSVVPDNPLRLCSGQALKNARGQS